MSKKRKIEGQVLPDISGGLLFSLPDVSFSVPVRKKLKLEGVNGGVRGIDAKGNTEVTVAWNAIDHVFCLPVPDRAKPMHNFVVIPSTEPVEAVVFAALEVNPKAPSPDQGPEAMAGYLDGQLAKYGKAVEWPDEEDFVSQIPPVGKGGKVFGVRSHRGSKEGELLQLFVGL